MNHDEQATWQRHCPVPVPLDGERITLAHGEGGRVMRKFIRESIVSSLGDEVLHSMGDATHLPQIDGRLAFTTDSFVVSPLFFPGGNIGSLSVYGTVNDLAVSGARPLYLALSLILEEGLPLAIVDRVLESVAQAAVATSARIVTGDTKVVPRGMADGLFINTTGVGQLIGPVPPGPSSLCEGDELIVTGPIGQHGIAVMCAREELSLEPPPQSDSGSLVRVAVLLREQLGTRLRTMRDATRGGVTAVLHEWAEASQHTLTISQADIPISPSVRGACELLGLDPLHVANEGTLVAAVEQGFADLALRALHSCPESVGAARIGRVEQRGFAPVTIRRTLGPDQPLDDPTGAPLPRIC
ncbi:MAG: hydrogenase expression/formation protein HypE [Planctomycetes bacterium]|nr:hydrogenase expression/formation protein HypE [Planctomycetota bacterium]